MRAILIPDGWLKAHMPEASTKIVLPPDGDPTNEEVRPCEVAIRASMLMGHPTPLLSVLWDLDEDDRARIAAGYGIMLTVWGSALQPHDLQVVPLEP